MRDDLAWHYTTAMGFEGIIKTWVVKVSTKDVAKGETPVAWFSVNPMLENTIMEMAFERPDRTVVRPRNAVEYRILGFGLYRVGVSAAELLTYPQLLKQAKIGFLRRKSLEKAAKQVGASPFEWRGSLSPVAIDGAAIIERFDGVRWIPLDRNQAEQVFVSEMEAMTPLVKQILASSRRDPLPVSADRLI